MNKLLAIDTALEACAVSVANGDRIHTLYEPMGRGQTERLLPMIVEACEKANSHLKDIEAVVTTRGPGSFTGVRVGLSVARTLSTVQDIPLYGLTTFEALSLFIEDQKEYGIVLESKRDDVYFQKHGEQAILSTTAEIKDKYPDLPLIGNVEGVQAVDLSVLTEKMVAHVRAGGAEGGGQTPVYLRGADISQSKKKYRTLSGDVLSGLDG